MRSKWAVALVCLLLFVAAVDTIPDPPAINPPARHASVSVLHLRGSFTLLEKQWYGALASIRRVQKDQFLARLALDEPSARISPLPRVHHATDTSPPRLPLSDPRFA